MTSTSPKGPRIRQTRRKLHDALVSLIHEKNYREIAVEEILERADVGRTTFYEHFRNKDALLASGIDGILQGAPARDNPFIADPLKRVVSFSYALFAYIGQRPHASAMRMHREGRAVVHRYLQRALIARVRNEIDAAGIVEGGAVPADLVAAVVVGTFMQVLTWWIETNSRLSPGEVDDVFLSLVVPALTTQRYPSDVPVVPRDLE